MTDQPNPAPLTLLKFPEKLAIVRLGPGADLPQWAESASLFSVTATAAETSVICATRSVPTKTPHIGPLTAFQVQGPLDPDAVGILHSLLAPLAEARVPVYTLSTFDTDWVLVRLVDADRAAEEWRRRGHSVTAAVPATPASSGPHRKKKK
ncbi:ACT domain-containing protein [Nocardioides seonyuensis]|uniref:ACT domain-containing protein n=1 Tax=Nocardioides seonyuensis TaxID=2518371 RepID=A0A4P7IKR3_9ACTN|nr:ACT domain-containing protein [Nocardioides seonyuensis]QBX56997.1 ACT domain-containing protein [Nocardioides seonyuensis]